MGGCGCAGGRALLWGSCWRRAMSALALLRCAWAASSLHHSATRRPPFPCCRFSRLSVANSVGGAAVPRVCEGGSAGLRRQACTLPGYGDEGIRSPTLRGRGETRQWLAPSPEFRNTYEIYLGPSRFVISNKHMRAAGILRLIAADHKKFRNHMIEHMQRRTHMGTHDICAQRCPPFQRFAPALARSQGRPTRLLARHAARIDGGDHSPHHPDATTHDRHHWQQKRCARVSRLSEKHNPASRNAS
jgi:hypothetical protein